MEPQEQESTQPIKALDAMAAGRQLVAKASKDLRNPRYTQVRKLRRGRVVAETLWRLARIQGDASRDARTLADKARHIRQGAYLRALAAGVEAAIFRVAKESS